MRDMTDLIADGRIDEAISSMKKTMTTVASSIGSIRDTDILTDWKDVYDEVRNRKDHFDEHGMAGIPTGFDTIDQRTGGVQPGQSWIIGARLGEGKSWALLRMAVSAVIAGYNVQFDALEMSRAEVGMRLHNFMSGAVGKDVFKSLSLAQGKDFDIKQYRQFLRELSSLQKGKLHVSDDRRIGALEIAAQIERNKPDIFFLDYLTLAKTQGDGGWQDIGKFSKDIKEIGGEYHVGMVSAAQLNRNATGREVAGAEDLAQADAIGQDADAVINMKKRSERITEAKLVKYRHGRSGYRFFIMTDMELGKMEEVSFNKAQDLIAEDKEKAAIEEENSR
jgi:replicative DNA helicase